MSTKSIRKGAVFTATPTESELARRENLRKAIMESARKKDASKATTIWYASNRDSIIGGY